MTRAPVAPVRSPSASTSTSTSSSSAGASTSTASAGNSAAAADAGLGAPVSEGGLDGLHTSTDAGNSSEAWAIFGTLSPGDIATLKVDTAFVPRFLHLVGPEHAATALWTLQYPIRVYLELANIHCAAQVASLAHVLTDVGIHGAGDLAHHTADLRGLNAFLVRVVLDPILAVSSAEEDALLISTTGGHDLLLGAYTDSPLVFLHHLGMDSAVALDLFLTSEPARAWLLETPMVLTEHIITHWDAVGPWYRSLARTLPTDLNGLVSTNPSAWATAFVDLFVAGNPEDTLLLTPPGDTFRLVIGVIAAQDPIVGAQACASLNLDRVECLLVFAAEGWLNRETVTALLDGTDVGTQLRVVGSPALCTALAAIAWIGDVLPLVTAAPALLTGFYATSAEARAWINVDAARFQLMAEPSPAMWVPFFLVARDVTMLLRFAVNNPTVWRAAVPDPLFLAVLGLLPKPCAEADVPGVWALWKDANRGVQQGLEAFHTLFGLRIWTSSAQPERTRPDWVDTSVTPNIVYEEKQVIATVDPTQETINQYLSHLQTIPRGQVAASAVGFGMGWNMHYKRKTPPADASWDLSGGPNFEDGGTSQYWSDMNFVLMYTDSAGAISGAGATAAGVDWISGAQRIASDGNASGAGGAGTTTAADGTTSARAATTDTTLTYFQNHARHEIGHGVGARAFQGMTTAGDDAAKKWENWKDSSAAAMRAAYYPGAAGNVTDVMDTAGNNTTVAASEIAMWMTTVIESGAEPAATATATGTGGQLTGAFAGTLADHLGGVTASSASAKPLVQYTDSIVGSNNTSNIPGGAYEYPNFTPPGTTTYIYSGAQEGFRKYDTEVMTTLLPVLGWYALSTNSELFAEIYTQHYSTAAHWVPATRKGVDWGTFFTQLEASPQSALQAGVAPTPIGVGGAPAPAAPTPTPVAGGGASPTPGPGSGAAPLTAAAMASAAAASHGTPL